MIQQILKKILLSALVLSVSMQASAADGEDNDVVNAEWVGTMEMAVDSFPQGGGYYTGRSANATFRRTAWRAMNESFGMQPVDSQPRLDVSNAQPSFGNMATYLLFLKTLKMWDNADGKQDITNLSWFSFKPFCGVTDVINNQGYNQNAGEGVWGSANAYGPGMAVIVKEFDAGFSFMGYRGAKSEQYREKDYDRYLTDEEWNEHPVWQQARKGDFMKIFWNRNESEGSDRGAIIGNNGKPDEEQEDSHSAVFMGYDEQGNLLCWGSFAGDDPATGGYGIATFSRADIQRVVFTRITAPEQFGDADKWRASKVNKWLKEIGRNRHGSTKELKKQCGID